MKRMKRSEALRLYHAIHDAIYVDGLAHYDRLTGLRLPRASDVLAVLAMGGRVTVVDHAHALPGREYDRSSYGTYPE